MFIVVTVHKKRFLMSSWWSFLSPSFSGAVELSCSPRRNACLWQLKNVQNTVCQIEIERFSKGLTRLLADFAGRHTARRSKQAPRQLEGLRLAVCNKSIRQPAETNFVRQRTNPKRQNQIHTSGWPPHTPSFKFSGYANLTKVFYNRVQLWVHQRKTNQLQAYQSLYHFFRHSRDELIGCLFKHGPKLPGQIGGWMQQPKSNSESDLGIILRAIFQNDRAVQELL